MKIAYLPFSPQFVTFARNLLKVLEVRHEIKVFITHRIKEGVDDSYLEGFNITYVPWSWFDFKDLFEFDPDLIIMWNGFAPWTLAAMHWLKYKLDYPMLHLERAWLPQSGNCYIADDLAAHSHFVMDMPEGVIPINTQGIEELKKIYNPKHTDAGLPDKFIFVPAQLDEDTSITRSSPLFKNCDSFLGALRYYIPEIPVIVKNHPKFTEKSRSSEVHLYSGPMSSLDLAAQATLTAGITSTVLTEALIYNKPIASVGYNVGMYSHVRCPSCTPRFFEKIRSVCIDPEKFKPERSCEETLSHLLSKQWSTENVPSWVIDYIESYI